MGYSHQLVDITSNEYSSTRWAQFRPTAWSAGIERTTPTSLLLSLLLDDCGGTLSSLVYCLLCSVWKKKLCSWLGHMLDKFGQKRWWEKEELILARLWVCQVMLQVQSFSDFQEAISQLYFEKYSIDYLQNCTSLII